MLRITNISYSTKIFKNKIKANKTKNAIMALPIISTPLVAYYSVKENRNIRNNSIQEEKTKCKELHSSSHPITDNTKYNTKALENAGYNKSEIEQHLDKNGNIADYKTKQILRSKNIPFKGDSDDLDAQSASVGGNYTGDLPQSELDVPNYNDVHSEIHSSGGFATMEPDNHGMGFGQISAGFGELQFPEGAEITEQLGHVADMLDNPVLEGVAAELLPGTKFLKPGKDLIDGDYEKATVGTLTRLGEIAIAPVKLGWAGFGALAGGISWLAGNRGEGVGLVGGFKKASHMWANGRNKLENTIIEREESDPNAQHVNIRDAYVNATNDYVRRVNNYADDEIRNINNSSAEEMKQNEIERLAAQKDYEIKHKSTVKIRDKAYARTRQGEEHRQASKEYLRELIAEKEQNFRYQQQMIAKLSADIKSAESDCNKKLATELEKQKADLEKIFKAQAKEALGSINYILEIAKQYEQIYKKNDAQGFASVAGYKETKNQLAAMFGVPLIQNKKNPNVKVPNVIALYGPKGTGKTIFGASLAKQFDCINGGSLLLKVGDDINFSRLMKIAEEAKTNFKKTGKRTIIQIDEVEFFGTKQTPSIWKRLRGKPENFEEFLSVCSDKYGCTLIVTTNEPNKIDDSIKSKMKFLYVPIANEEDMAEILKFHVNNRNKENINYKKLVSLLVAKTKDGSAFTNARLEDIVKTVISRHGVLNQKLLEEEIANREPDISKEEINFYKKDFKLCK